MRLLVLGGLLLVCACTSVESLILGALPPNRADAAAESDEDASDDERVADVDASGTPSDSAMAATDARPAQDAGSDARTREEEEEEEEFQLP